MWLCGSYEALAADLVTMRRQSNSLEQYLYIGSGGGSAVIRGLAGIREALERDQRKYKKDRRGLTERSEKKQPGYGYIW